MFIRTMRIAALAYEHAMVNQGLRVRLEAKPGKDADVGFFEIGSARGPAGGRHERMVRHPLRAGEYGIFDVFPKTAWCTVHLDDGDYGVFDCFPTA